MKFVPQLDASRSHSVIYTLAIHVPNSVKWNKNLGGMPGRTYWMRRGSWADKYGRFGETRFLCNADTNMYGVTILETATFIFINVRIQGLT